MSKIVTIPVRTCGNGLHTEFPAREPVFHFTHPAGSHGIVGLDTVKI